MATDFKKSHSPTSDFPAEETQTNQESQQQEAVNETLNNVFYKMKKIQFFGGAKNIILQDKIGPCPLIAICNFLILRNDLSLDPDSLEVSQQMLLGLLAKTLILNSNLDSNDAECINNQTLSDAIELLPRLALADGISVHPKVMRIYDFEFTSALALFRLLNIPLCHGCIIEPKDLETARGVGSKSYSGLTIETQTVKARSGQSSSVYEDKSILRQASSEGKDTNGLTPEEGEVIKKFLDDNASQLTRHGLF